MRDKIPHMRIIDRALCLVFPGVIGAGVVRKNPDDMDVIDVFERGTGGRNQFAPKDEVQALGHIAVLCFQTDGLGGNLRGGLGLGKAA
jgi:hypothetical protein